MNIGEYIKKSRKTKGLTLVQLGAAVDVSNSALSQIENNKTEPSRKTLIALAKALGDNFGLEWLDEHLSGVEAPPSKREIVEKMSAREFLSIKFGGGQGRRSKAEAEMLAKLLDAELERMKNEGW